jgi:hypothetical protein
MFISRSERIVGNTEIIAKKSTLRTEGCGTYRGRAEARPYTSGPGSYSC